MREKARPLMEVGIDELIEMADDREEWPALKIELAFRKTRKAVKLAKTLGCVTKRRPSTREQMACWDQGRVSVIPVTFPTAEPAGEVL